MIKRYSKKRQSILDCLRATTDHPDAEWIYRKLKPVYPDLSVGTVYRNLGELRRAGEIVSVGTVDGKERFDGRTAPHAHIVCGVCGRIADAEGILPSSEVIGRLEKETAFSLVSAEIRFVGICAACRATREKSES